MAIYTTKNISAAPRSVESTRIITCSAANTVTIQVCLKVVDLLNIDATNITYRIFTNSAGCTENAPMLNVRLAPYTLLPRRTAHKSTSPATQ